MPEKLTIPSTLNWTINVWLMWDLTDLGVPENWVYGIAERTILVLNMMIKPHKAMGFGVPYFQTKPLDSCLVKSAIVRFCMVFFCSTDQQYGLWNQRMAEEVVMEIRRSPISIFGDQPFRMCNFLIFFVPVNHAKGLALKSVALGA